MSEFKHRSSKLAHPIQQYLLMVFIKDASEEKWHKGVNYMMLEKGSLVVSVIYKSCLELLGRSLTQCFEHGVRSQTTHIQIQVLPLSVVWSWTNYSTLCGWAALFFFWYNIVIQQFYTFLNTHHDKCGSHRSPYLISILLTIFSMLYFSSLCLIHCITGGLYLSIPFPYFTPLSSASGNHEFFSLYLWVYYFFLVFSFFWIPHISEIIWYSSFSDFFHLS